MTMVEYSFAKPNWLATPSVSETVELKLKTVPVAVGQLVTSSVASTSSIAVTAGSKVRVSSSYAAHQYARMSVREKLRFNAKYRRSNLAISCVGIVAAGYVATRSVIELYQPLAHLFSIAAIAQDSAPAEVIYTSRDAFDWFVGLMMALVLVTSIAASYLAKTETKIQHAQDMTKVVVGFAVGFLGGGRPGS